MSSRRKYYEEKKEKIKAINRENYHKKKPDPEHYQKLLERNQEYYEKKVKTLPPLTDEDRARDEKQMYEIMAWVRKMREEREIQEKPKKENKNYMLY